MIGHRVLISCTIDNSWDCILNYHPSIHPPSTSSRDPFFCPSIIPSSVLPAIYQHIDKKKMLWSAYAGQPSLYSSLSSSTIPSSFQLFIPLLHPFIFCGWVDVHYLSIILSFIILPSVKHATQLYCCARPLCICHIIHISSCFPADTHLSAHSKLFFIFLHPYSCSPFPVVSQSESLRNFILSPKRCIIGKLR